MFGVLAGQILRLRRELPERLVRLFVTGSLLLAAGLICTAWLPINKKLWTDSFSLFMAGLDFIVFAIFAWFIDDQGWRKPARPFVIFGMNAIALYMVSEGLAEFLDAVRVGPLTLQQSIYRGVVRAPGLARQRLAALFAQLRRGDLPGGVFPVPARLVPARLTRRLLHRKIHARDYVFPGQRELALVAARVG